MVRRPNRELHPDVLNGRDNQKRARLYSLIVCIAAVIVALVIVLFRSDLLEKPGRMLYSEATGPLQEKLFIPLAALKKSVSSHMNVSKILEENRMLRAELEQLRSEITSYREAIIENRRLRQLLQVKEKQQAPTIVADVVGLDLTPWKAVIKIDKGKKDGVMEEMPVLTGAGVIGRVIEASPSYSTVMLITDFDSRVAAIIQRNRARGILVGQGKGPCSLEYVEKGIDVEPGDVVITSGLDGIYPKGLLLGKVVDVAPAATGELFQSIRVEPFSRLDTVEGVLVMLTARE